MKETIAYRCEHCGKVYLKAYACKKHEEKVCPLNPEIQPLCYSCQHYSEELESEEIGYYYEDQYGRSDRFGKSFNVNTCQHPDNPCKLFNNVKLSEAIQKGLAEADFKAMPTRGTGGCPFYEGIPNHPYAKKLSETDNT